MQIKCLLIGGKGGIILDYVEKTKSLLKADLLNMLLVFNYTFEQTQHWARGSFSVLYVGSEGPELHAPQAGHAG